MADIEILSRQVRFTPESGHSGNSNRLTDRQRSYDFTEKNLLDIFEH
jgi:hypothetical protein